MSDKTRHYRWINIEEEGLPEAYTKEHVLVAYYDGKRLAWAEAFWNLDEFEPATANLDLYILIKDNITHWQIPAMP